MEQNKDYLEMKSGLARTFYFNGAMFKRAQAQ